MSPAPTEPISKTELAWLKSGNILNGQRLIVYEEMESLEREFDKAVKLTADVERSGYERGVREAAKQCLVKEEIGIGFSPRNRIPGEIHNAILSLLATKPEDK